MLFCTDACLRTVCLDWLCQFRQFNYLYVILQDKGLGLDDGGYPADDSEACKPYFEEMHLSSNSCVDLQSNVLKAVSAVCLLTNVNFPASKDDSGRKSCEALPET